MNNNSLEPYDISRNLLEEIARNVTDDKTAFKDLLTQLTYTYRRGSSQPGENYSRLDFQCAYIFLYFPFQATMMDLPGVRSTLKAILSRDQIQVCSLGGGPGTDFVGLALLRKNLNLGVPKTPPLTGVILEKFTEWGSVFNAVKQVSPLRQYVSDEVTYQSYDFHQQITDEVRSEIKKADLVTMVEFLSEVLPCTKDTEKQLKSIFREMKKDAILLVIDNTKRNVVEPLEKVAEPYLTNLYREDSFCRFRSKSSEKLDQQFVPDFKTKVTGHIFISVWKKN